MTDFLREAPKYLGIALTAVFVLLLIWYLARYFTECFGKNRLGRAYRMRPETSPWKVLLLVLAAFVISRLILLLGGAVWAYMKGELDSYVWSFPWNWIRWDAHHYLGLIENWYVNEGDPRYHIVFFPLYPAICRVIHLATGLDAMPVAFFVSNAFFIACGYIMFRLGEMAARFKGGVRAMLLFMFSPLTLFCSVPYTESTFLLTTLAAVYLARKRRFFWAVVMGALSSNARMAGMATAIPIFYEILRASGRPDAKKIAVSVLKVLPVSLGLIAYLALNWQITGDPFKFLEYQAENWSQQFGSLMNTTRYTLENAISFHDQSYRAGVWIPQIISIVSALALFAAAPRRMHPGDAGYGLVYFYLSVAPTWLLSGPRYLTAMYPAYLILAISSRRKWDFGLILTFFALMCAAAGAMFAVEACIL